MKIIENEDSEEDINIDFGALPNIISVNLILTIIVILKFFVNICD